MTRDVKRGNLCVRPPSSALHENAFPRKFIKTFPFPNHPPGRWRFFAHLNIREARTFASIITYNFPTVPDPVTSRKIIDGGELIKRRFGDEMERRKAIVIKSSLHSERDEPRRDGNLADIDSILMTEKLIRGRKYIKINVNIPFLSSFVRSNVQC